MSAAPRDKPKRSVRVRKMWRNTNDKDNFVLAGARRWWANESCHVITGYSGSAKQLKRLVEIDYYNADRLACKIIDTYNKTGSWTSGAEVLFEALGLKPANGGRKT